MRYAFFLILISGPAGAWAAPDLAGCRFADPPQVIPGIDATKNEMANMGATVRAYIQDMNDSLACLAEKDVVVRQYACDRLSATCFANLTWS